MVGSSIIQSKVYLYVNLVWNFLEGSGNEGYRERFLIMIAGGLLQRKRKEEEISNY